MLRIHLLQQWYLLSDPAMEEALILVRTMRRFSGIDLIGNSIPDETRILTFCHPLEKHKLGEQISCFGEDSVYAPVKAHLSARGMTMRQGTIVDATLIAAPSSAKTKAGQRDPEMHQNRMGNQWYFEIKVSLGIDKDSCLIHSVFTTSPNVCDFTPAAELLHGDEEAVYGDSGYQDIANRSEMAGETKVFRLAVRPANRRVPLGTLEGRVVDLIEMATMHIRAKGKHPFRVIKEQFGFQKTRLRGLAKKPLQGQDAGNFDQSVFWRCRLLMVPLGANLCALRTISDFQIHSTADSRC